MSKSTDPSEIGVKLYLAERDGIRDDPYTLFYLPDHYRASSVLYRGRGFCMSKASFLCAMGRACGIPSRGGFATVRNRLATKQLIASIGSDLFVYYSFVEFYLGEKWVKATPAFNIELCQKHHIPPLEVNGREDSLFQAYNLENKKFIDYIEFHGIEADIPVDRIFKSWMKAHGEARVKNWIKQFEETEGQTLSRFEKEE